MPSLSTYYLTVQTGQNYDSTDYDAAAGAMVALLTQILSDKGHLTDLVQADINKATTEIEVLMEDGELVGKAVLDVQSAQKVKFDKTKFSKLVKQHSPWPNVRISKRQVNAEVEP